ncbi:MAG: hypothetical protein IPM57_04010 [Oligoflexia bacterium]|nr:hypothetical protein [Oligoflexia bacterium]
MIRICDEIILELKVGRSFTSVAKEKVEKNQQLKMLLLKTNNIETKQFNQVISFCLQYPSLAYKVIFAFRNKIFLSNKLKEKQKTVLVQPRAQGVVSAALYFGIFLFQLHFHPGFLDVFHVGLGRKLMVLSFFLLLSGLYVVFFYFKPKESHFL